MIGTGPIGIGAIAAPGEGGPAPSTAITLPLRLQIQASPPIALPLRLKIGATGAALVLPLRLSIISDAVLGGLDGAGGWPSSPSGRWRAYVTLAGEEISGNLAGEIVVAQADNEARSAEFSFRPSAAMQPMSLIGQRVEIWFAQRGEFGEAVAAQRIFAGVLETPTIDLQSGLIACSCHDQLQEVISNTPREWIDTRIGGRWRQEVSGEPEDTWDYLEARRLSVPISVALDAHQQPRFLHWRDGLASITVRTADMVDGSLSLSLPSRDELRTRIVCRMQYRFERLRGRSVVAGYSNGLRFYIGAGEIEPSKFWLTTAMVKGATESLRGWTAKSISIENPLPGSYPRGPDLADGFYTIPRRVAPDLALGFEARYQTRWQQTVTEDYTVEVVLPDLEAAIGRVSEEIGANLDVPFDVREWGDDETVHPVLDIPSVGDVISEWKPTGQGDDDRDEVLRTLLDQAWVKLWDSSRSGRVTFALPLRPNLWLDNLATVITDKLTARGKVVDFEHRMDTEGGEAVTTVSIAVGLPGDESSAMPAWTLPSAPPIDDTRPPSAYSFEIGTFVGGAGASVPFDEEAMIGFSTNLEESPVFAENFYPHQLSIRAPDVDAIDRDPITLEASVVIETTIPTDLLELS